MKAKRMREMLNSSSDESAIRKRSSTSPLRSSSSSSAYGMDRKRPRKDSFLRPVYEPSPHSSRGPVERRRIRSPKDRPSGAEKPPDHKRSAAGSSSSSSGSKKPTKSTPGKSAKQEEAPTSLPSSSPAFQRLVGAQFRWINEQLYTASSKDAVGMMARDPALFDQYHEGFRAQAALWPERPLDHLVRQLRSDPKAWVVGDFGCGDAELAASVPQKVHSFDLVARRPGVVAADIAHVPLPDGALDVAVYSLALMCTNVQDFVAEANRVLRVGGALRIAEVSSRFPSAAGTRRADVRPFVRAVERLGFMFVKARSVHDHFELIELVKTGPAPPPARRPDIALKPCIYKRR